MEPRPLMAVATAAGSGCALPLGSAVCRPRVVPHAGLCCQSSSASLARQPTQAGQPRSRGISWSRACSHEP